MKKYFLYCILLLLISARTGAQDSYTDRANKYIEQYYALAIAEQKAAGIPASITLGQGILETEAGTSELMTEANNHFGIKCKNGWTGETFLHDDDAPGECFKKYKCAADSYHDHSEHLKRNPRYAPLFKMSKTDYAAWAVGLKKCGYATNPQYAERLIKIIEDFKLQDYTYSAMSSEAQVNYPTIPEATQAAAMVKPASVKVAAAKQAAAEDSTGEDEAVADTPVKTAASFPDPLKKMADSSRNKIMGTTAAPGAGTDVPVQQAPAAPKRDGINGKYENGKLVTVNGLRAFYALKGEMLLQYAVKYNVRYQHLLEVNDLPDAPLPFNMYVYLDRKLTYGIHAKHTVANGETLLMIAQAEAMQIKRIMALNYLKPNEEPATGAVLELQVMAARKPDIIMDAAVAHKPNTIGAANNTSTSQDNDYIALRKPAADATDDSAAAGGEKGYVEYVAGSDYKGNLSNTPEPSAGKEDTAKEEDLTSLKAELDKVVYADDSKLPAAKTTAPKKPAAQAAQPAQKKGGKYYKVKRGDTAFSIAKRNDITVRQLLKWNDIDADEVQAGQNLRVKE